MVLLYDALKTSYGNKQSRDKIKNEGYVYDSMLSNKNNQVWINKNDKKIIQTIKGTNPLSLRDIGTDIYLGLGKLEQTNRYKESKNILNQAKQKYTGFNTTIAGHSLGASIGSRLANKNDKFYGLNEGVAPFQKTRSYDGNHQHIRTAGDAVSILGANSTHLKTIKNNNYNTGIPILNTFNAHNVSTIRNSNIKI
jgi:hypothetical protein